MSKIFKEMASLRRSGEVDEGRSGTNMGAKIGVVFAFLLSAAAAFGAYFLYQSFAEERGFRLTLEQKYGEAKDRMQTLLSEKDQFVAVKDKMQKDLADYQQKSQDAENQIEQIRSASVKALNERAELEKQVKERDEKLSAMERKVAELQRKAEEMMRACNITPSDLKASLTAEAPVSENVASNIVSSDDLTFSSPMGSPAPGLETVGPSADEGAPSPAFTEDPTALSADPASSGTTQQPEPAAVQSPEQGAPPEASAGAKVLTVNRKFNFVVVNIGLKDGLKIGDQLKIVKSGADSATVQVEKLYDRFAAATILTEDSKNQVVEGDAVSRG